MKKILFRFASIGALFALAPAAWAAGGLSGTAHDFSGIGTPATGSCTFCHTPHQAQVQGLLWNHTLSANSFNWAAGEVTTGGTDYSSFGPTYNGPTVKCLSCHDGSVAVGDVGWWNAGDPGILLAVNVGPPYQIGPGGDMTGNHPVAMPFPLNSAVNTYNTITNGAAAATSGWKADPTSFNIVLYNDDGGGNISRGAVAGSTGIECGSCHDPHNGPNTGADYFLYGNLGGSTGADGYICEKCHDKSGA